MDGEWRSCVQQKKSVRVAAPHPPRKYPLSITRSVDVQKGTTIVNIPSRLCGSSFASTISRFCEGSCSQTSSSKKPALGRRITPARPFQRKQLLIASAFLSGVRRGELAPLCNVPPPLPGPPCEAVQRKFGISKLLVRRFLYRDRLERGTPTSIFSRCNLACSCPRK